MSVLLDILLIAVLAICVVVGWKRGFIRALRGFVTYILSFAVANSLYRLLAKSIIALPFLQNMITDVDMPDIPANATFLDKVSAIIQYISEQSGEEGLGGTSEVVEAVINNYIAELLAAVISFLIVFLVTVLVLKLLLWILDMIVSRMPIIRHANGLLGCLIGLLNGFFWTWMISNVFVNFALPFLSDKWPAIFGSAMANSFVVNLCTKINPITYLFMLINLISN